MNDDEWQQDGVDALSAGHLLVRKQLSVALQDARLH
jgi:hypothetical protein